MSYNIDSTRIIKSDNFRISEEQYKEWHYDFLQDKLDTPEWCFMDEIEDCAELVNGEYIFHRLPWCYSWSGNSFDYLKNHLLPKFKGSADIILTWEGGDAHSGLRVVDGRVTEHNIVFALGEEC